MVVYFAMSIQQFVCLSGLSRSGSTLLSAILSQNPQIHTEGNSAVCQLIWDIYISYRDKCIQQLKANNKQDILVDLISMVPNVYYKNRESTKTIVVDKCRSWTLDSNIQMLKACIDPNIKVIVLERPIKDVINSFAQLYHNNGITGEALESELLQILKPGSEPILRSFDGIKWAKANNSANTFIFIKYDDFVKNPRETMVKIYGHCGWTWFEHNFNNIIVKNKEDDTVYGIDKYHEVRPKIGKLQYDYNLLTEKVINICNSLCELDENSKINPIIESNTIPKTKVSRSKRKKGKYND